MTRQSTLVEHLDRPRLTSVDGRVWQALAQDGGWVPRTRLSAASGGAVVHSAVARLRDRGWDVRSRRDPVDPASGAWEYRLVGCWTANGGNDR